MKRKAVLSLALFAAGLMTCVGCGDNRPKLAPVIGKVTYQGKPVPEGRVIFHPERGRPAIGSIGADGSYRLTTFKTDDGAMPGRYVVTIEAIHVSGGTQPKSPKENVIGNDIFSAPPTTITRLVPEKYSRPDTLPLTAEVKPGPNNIDFDLPAGPGRSSP